jgi:hypothetical protein
MENFPYYKTKACQDSMLGFWLCSLYINKLRVINWYIKNHQTKKKLYLEDSVSFSKWGPFLFYCLILPFGCSCCCCLVTVLPTLSHYAAIMIALHCYNSKTHFLSTLHLNLNSVGLVVPHFLSKLKLGTKVQIVASGMVSRVIPCQVM